jgi:hypothetical protein
MKHPRKRKQNESSPTDQVKTEVDVTQTPQYIQWHKENHSPLEHSEFLSRGVNTPLGIVANTQPHET